MATFQIIAALAGLAVFAWPFLPRLAGYVKGAGPTYRESILNLAQVRSRLLATGHLDDDQKKAIDVLTLALVDGSDK